LERHRDHAYARQGGLAGPSVYGPSTSFIANSGERMNDNLPPPYAPYAEQLFAAMGQGKTTAPDDVARAVLAAATDGSDRLRYPAGPDAEDLAALRSAQPGEAYLRTMRAMMGPKAG
jgi:hypothetical protein